MCNQRAGTAEGVARPSAVDARRGVAGECYPRRPTMGRPTPRCWSCWRIRWASPNPRLRIARGHSSRDKVVAVDGLDAGEVRRMLEAATL